MWKTITSDRCIIDNVKHRLKVDLETLTENDCVPVISKKDEEKEEISEEINKLLNKRVIIECNREKGGFISSVFTRRRKMAIWAKS